MAMEITTGQFVHVVATIDVDSGVGKILYVNPATSSVAASDAGHPDVELVVEDTEGAEVLRRHPVVRFSVCESGARSSQGLIQEDLAVQPGMKRIKLLLRGDEKSRFEAGGPPPPSARASAGIAPHVSALTPGEIDHRVVKPSFAVAPEPGVSYAVQARRPRDEAWQTIAVGSETPDVEVDANQFPGAGHVRLRVLRSTGFEDTILWEGDVDLSDGR